MDGKKYHDSNINLESHKIENLNFLLGQPYQNFTL